MALYHILLLNSLFYCLYIVYNNLNILGVFKHYYIYNQTFSGKCPLLGGHSTVYMYEIVSLFKVDTVNL